MEKKRGIWLYILAAMALLLSAVQLYFIVSGVLSGERLLPQSKNILWILYHVVFNIQPLAGLAAGIGVLLLKNWARILLIIVCATWLSYSLFSFLIVVVSGRLNIIGFFTGMLVLVLPFVASIFYFTRAKVKEQFK